MFPTKQVAVYAEADEMLRLGEESESAWNNPVTLVMIPEKKQGDKEGRVSASKHKWNPKQNCLNHIYQQCRPETCLLANRAGGRESTDHCIYCPWKALVPIRRNALWAV